jgi:ribonucleotide monophosphatase NagD (HAD superfamily)
MARDAGAIAVLTLTGETQQADVDTAAEPARPDIVVANLDEFARLLQETRDVG